MNTNKNTTDFTNDLIDLWLAGNRLVPWSALLGTLRLIGGNVNEVRS